MFCLRGAGDLFPVPITGKAGRVEGESDDLPSIGEETWRKAASDVLVFVSFSVVFTIPMFLC